MIKRDAEISLLKMAKQFKSVAVIGPRQSGKTTLVKAVFPKMAYVNLENPDHRKFASEDARGFLSTYRDGAILDEVQRVPELFSYLQQVLDDSNKTGQFILTGSNNFLLQENISQSLAGRIGLLTLLPFSMTEVRVNNSTSINELLFRGLYPPLYDKKFDTVAWYANYISTYVERDVRLIKNITNFSAFEKFIKLCAGRCGQLLNMNNLAIEAGVDSKTIASWLGILEMSYIIFKLYPHHKNFNKRVVKMPKIYFYDTGLTVSLLGIESTEQLTLHPFRGCLFENLIVMELLKQRFNRGLKSNLSFWRDNVGHEIDLLLQIGNTLTPVEIKAGQTVTGEYFNGLEFWEKINPGSNRFIIYSGHSKQKRSNGIEILSFFSIQDLN
jgi:predicted AAA+ superfamily ATPase